MRTHKTPCSPGPCSPGPALGRRTRAARRRHRQGVILLVVLALLSLFAVISLTYVLVASQFRRTARANSSATLARHDTSSILDEAALQVFAGTRNARSVLGPHSLLEDLYGRDAYAGQIVGTATAIQHPVSPTNPVSLGGEMLLFDFSVDLGPDGRPGNGGVDDDQDGTQDNLSEVGWRGSDDNLFGSDIALDVGPDLKPGVANTDDDGNGTTDDALELGWPGSDDREVGQSGAPGFANRDDDDDDANGNDDNAGVVDYSTLGANNGRPDFGEWGAAGSDDYRLSPYNGYYNGRVLTFVSGPAAGQSVRITGYEIQGGTYDRTADVAPGDANGDNNPADNLLDPRSDNSTDSLNPVQRFAVGKLRVTFPSGIANPADLIGSRILINGAPFNGLGFGVSPQSVQRFRSETMPPMLPQSPQMLLGATAAPFLNPFLPQQPALWQRALMPNAAMFDRTPGTWAGTVNPTGGLARDVYVDPAGIGGADEEYDAVDYQNMLLAMRRTVCDLVAPATDLSAPPLVEMPSLHRPDLAYYWLVRLARDIQTNYGGYGLGTPPNDQTAALMAMDPMGLDVNGPSNLLPPLGRLVVTSLKRRFSLRPLREDHPNFTGSNPIWGAYSPASLANEITSVPGTTLEDVLRRAWEVNGLGLDANGPAAVGVSPISSAVYTTPQWDVDNDGDGVADSIWVDLGFPVQTSADGRAVKPLVAILCVDLDGRLNLNAHGTLNHLPGAGDPSVVTSGNTAVQFSAPLAGKQPASLTGVLPGSFGQGYGPAEINLMALLQFGSGYDFDINNDGSTDATDKNLELYHLLRGAALTANPQPSADWVPDGRYGESNAFTRFYTVHPGPGRTATTAWQFEEMRHVFSGFDSFIYDSDIELSPGAATRLTAGEPYNYRLGANLALNLQPDGGGSTTPAFLRLTGVYGSPSDVDGDGLLALDHRGQPMYLPSFDQSSASTPIAATGFGERATERLDDPYEVNLYGHGRGSLYKVNVSGNLVITARDNPFRPDELEPLFRAFDSDAGTLANRIGMHAPSLANNPRLRNLVTTDSWDLPVPSLPVTFDAAKTDNLGTTNVALFDFVAPGQAQLVDLVRTALARRDKAFYPALLNTPAPSNPFDPVGQMNTFNLVAAPGSVGAVDPAPASTAAVDRDRTRLNWAVTQLLPADLMAGLKFDLNRPFGNGIDDDRDGLIDEADEVFRGVDLNSSNNLDQITEVRNEPVLAALDNDPNSDLPTGLTFPNAGYPSDPNGDGKFDGSDYLVRQQYAKTLYVLLHLLHDQGLEPFVFDLIDDGSAGDGTIDDEEKARLFAQWAVNVVDYRDRDSIMTPFEYDIFPFKDDNVPADGLPWDVDGFVGRAPGPNDGFRPVNTSTNSDGAWGARNSDDDNDGLIDEPGETGGDDINEMDPTSDDGKAYRGLVWGCERPELLITETLAFHDRRSTDDSVGGGTVQASSDNDFDQTKRPKGSLFIELYHPGPLGTAQIPEGSTLMPSVELYDSTLTGLQLNKTATDGMTTSPVWRLAIAPPLVSPNPGATPAGTPYDPVIKPADLTNWRVVYFASASGINDSAKLHFYPDQSVNSYQILPPGRYAVLGPRDFAWQDATKEKTTYIGRNNGTGVYPRRILLDPNTAAGQINRLLVFDDGDVRRYPIDDPSSNNQSIQPPLTILIDQATNNLGADQNTSGSSASFRRFSVSEPIGGYGAFATPPTGSTEGVYTPVDVPFDQDSTLPTGLPPLLNYNNGTYLNFTTVYLQRLANPTQIHNDKSNPYVTVDQQSIDLTIYNGEEYAVIDTSLPGGVQNVKLDSRQRGDRNTRSMWTQASRQPQRVYDVDGTEFGGDLSTASPPIPAATLGYLNMSLPHTGTSKTVTLPPATAMPGTGEVAAAEATGMFGFGWRYSRDSTNGDRLPTVPASISTSGYAEQYVGDPDTTTTNFASQLTFPWLPWPNRPLISQYELLQVPATGPSQLLGLATDRANMQNGRMGWNSRQPGGEYWKPPAGPGSPPNGRDLTELSFGHLAPWFLKDGEKLQEPSAPSTSLQTGFQLPHPGPGMHRLLELVYVPTRFLGAEDWLNPNPDPIPANPNPYQTVKFQADYSIGPLGDDPYRQFDVPQAGYAAPFNKVSTYREPGRVNLNTMFDPLVWRAVTHDVTGSDEQYFWDQIWASRRGFASPALGSPAITPWATTQRALGKGVSVDFDPRSPSYFSNPFRGVGGNFLVPINELRFDTLDPSGTGVRARTDIDVGLLRPMPQPAVATDPAPLFAQTFASTSDAWRNTNQNPYFRYQMLTKLGNVATNRSNVYAVWITIGYFEVEPVDGTTASPAANNNLAYYNWADPMNAAVGPWGQREFYRVFPDGLRLGQELGSDTGSIRRQRAFYIFDRSIPVGFERGRRHNVENAILLRRIIE